MKSTAHPLEHHAEEASYFAKQGEHGAAAYRRAVTAITGSLPTWAERHKPGRKAAHQGITN